MCCCGKPVINGQDGYSWDGKSFGVRPVDPPELQEGDQLLRDEPGRCGGLDSHCHHYRLVKAHGYLSLLVKNGGGEKRIRLHGGPITDTLLSLDSTSLYWLLNTIYHAQSDARSEGSRDTYSEWARAAAEKRIKTRKVRGSSQVTVRIVPAVRV